MRNLVAVTASLALLALSAPGCGSDKKSDKSGSAKTNEAEPAEQAGGSGGAAKKAVAVSIASFKFVPGPIKVKAGGTVTWKNQDKAKHTAQTEVGAPGEFTTGDLTLGDSKKVTFAKPGKFSYFCIYHRFMTGTVEVVQ